jgi:hypothetical protein
MLLGAWHSGIWCQVLLNIRAIVNRPGFHAPSGFWSRPVGHVLGIVLRLSIGGSDSSKACMRRHWLYQAT